MRGRRGWAAGGAVAERKRGGGPAIGRYNAPPLMLPDRDSRMFEHALIALTTADALPSTAVAWVHRMHGRNGGADPG